MIRIENLYFLLCYAWGILPERGLLHVGTEKGPNVLNLLANVFLNHLARQLKQGLPHRYVAIQKELQGIRGRLLFSETIGNNRVGEGRTVCRFDEFGPNHAANRIVKETLLRLCHTEELAGSLRQQAMRLRRNLTEIGPTEPNDGSQLRHLLQQTRMPSERLLLHVAQLLQENLLVTEQTGRFMFQEFWRDERRMGAVFETFVRNFYRMEQNRFSVKREHIDWQLDANEADRHFLPRMVTDLSLEETNRKVIIDTKYYVETLQRHFDAQKVHSAHLYQLFAYLKNQPFSNPQELEGILLYPVVDRSLSLRYVQGIQTIRVETLDLAQPWQHIHAKLLELLQKKNAPIR